MTIDEFRGAFTPFGASQCPPSKDCPAQFEFDRTHCLDGAHFWLTFLFDTAERLDAIRLTYSRFERRKRTWRDWFRRSPVFREATWEEHRSEESWLLDWISQIIDKQSNRWGELDLQDFRGEGFLVLYPVF
jgi:hypothetical protein